ncbi:exosortase-dependent surface protein XDP2 [Anabaena sp. CCY 9402-a]|uniref:exosortase-dependent surface protein XDP2 n=1 Tax=Anabaena sp. CCY 9402-a TaxID=3103867 RepID=UPI0039C675F2
MKVKNIFISTGLVLSAVLGVSSSAKAASFTTNFSPDPVTDPTADIELLSIVRNDGKTISDFKLVNSATIIKNLGALGPASTDNGDTATPPTGLTPNENPLATEIAAYLNRDGNGKINLNNIIDSEDSGEFDINVFFDSAVASNNTAIDSIFLWERGLNSSITLQAVDAGGSLLGSAYTIDKSFWELAGFQIDTTEVGAAQNVGSQGVSFANLGLTSGTLVSGLKLTAHSSFHGPDFKLVAHDVFEGVVVPEPTTMLGLGSVAALALLRRRQGKKTAY